MMDGRAIAGWRRLSPRAAGGWTLIEAMVVVSILSIMAAIGLPQMGTLLANGRVRSAAQSLQDGLAIAQAEALRRSTNVELLLTTSDPTQTGASIAAQASNWSVRVPADATRGIATTSLVRSATDASQLAPTIENRAGAVGIVFGPSGRVSTDTAGAYTPTTGNVTFRITAPNSDRPLCVYTTMAGSVKTCDPKLGASDFRSCVSTVTSPIDCPAG